MISKVVFAAVGVASILAMVAGPVAHAQSGLSFPIVGIAGGQAARLNVLNLAANSPANPSTCSVELQFLDTSGKPIQQTGVQVPAGQSVFLELRQAELPGERRRSSIRAVVIFGASGGAAPPTVRATDCGNLLPSLEVYDRDSGRTILLVTTTKDLPPSFILPP